MAKQDKSVYVRRRIIVLLGVIAVALALIGFLGSVAVTRFRVPDENVSAPTGAEDEEGTAR